MLAAMGYITDVGIKFADVPNGLATISEVPAARRDLHACRHGIHHIIMMPATWGYLRIWHRLPLLITACGIRIVCR